MSTLSLALQLGGAVPTSPRELILNATLVTQVVLVVLAALSLVSWAVMFAMSRELSRSRKQGRSFLDKFDKSRTLLDATTMVKFAGTSAFTRLFQHAMRYVQDTQGVNQQQRERELGDVAAPPLATLTGSQIETL